ncbi:Fungal-specific transcription factor domain-containing protein [Pleurostoma richardsiae]|uniref:Fungal-specific transcription factor domain-containing protein n=1 Tax=Pleurostoma richardsiae TaxID=41990 RepID=A0AA38VDQ2_9PEZI|nr:Fungal-specific transcription factor domain-containing protein [Pleurostoma richardsiae]
MNYTRKRALLACDFCRHRKRRCDGEKPCGTCREANADCVYKDLPVDRVEPQSSTQGAVVDRLSRIEALLEEQGQRLNDIAQGVPSPYGPNSLFLASSQGVAASPASTSARSVEGGTEAYLEHAQFLIPYDHSTAAVSLLALPAVRSLIGDFPKSYFYTIEENSSLPPPLDLLHPAPVSWPGMDPGVLDSLTSTYFCVVHPNYPLFTQEYFKSLQASLLENGPSETAETAICFCVWALGSLAAGQPPVPSTQHLADQDDMGLEYFIPAWRIILCRTIWGFTPNLEICQALLLAGSYFAHLGKPLHSWKMIHFACHKFLQLFYKKKRAGMLNELTDSCLRVFWTCFMIECDRVAELDVARTGVEPMADKMPLPRSLDESETDVIIYFIAETAIRRLLNRIHSSLYSTDNADLANLAEPSSTPASLSLNRLLAVSSELNRQLEEWYSSIPGKLRPPIGVEPLSSQRGKILRVRYYAARHIIHRPFVLFVAQQQGPGSTGSHPTTPQPLFNVPRIVLEKCNACLASCEAYLYNVAEMLDERSPYLWTFSQSCLACLLVMVIANSSHQLRPLTPDLDPLFALIIPRLRKWAVSASSFEAEVKILETLRARTVFSTS